MKLQHLIINVLFASSIIAIRLVQSLATARVVLWLKTNIKSITDLRLSGTFTSVNVWWAVNCVGSYSKPQLFSSSA